MAKLASLRNASLKAKDAFTAAQNASRIARAEVERIKKELRDHKGITNLRNAYKAAWGESKYKKARLKALEGQLKSEGSELKKVRSNAALRNALKASELDSGSAAYYNYLLAVDEATDSASAVRRLKRFSEYRKGVSKQYDAFEAQYKNKDGKVDKETLRAKRINLKKTKEDIGLRQIFKDFPDYAYLFDKGMSLFEIEATIDSDMYQKIFKEDLPKKLVDLARGVTDALRVRNKKGEALKFSTATEARAWAKENGIAVPESTQEYETRYFIRESLLYENDADRFAADLDERIEQSEKPDRNPTMIMLDGRKYNIADQDGGTMLLFPADAQSKDGMISSVRTVDDAVKCIIKIYDSIAKERAENSAKWQATKKGSLDYENALSFRVWNPDAEWNEGEYDEKSDADANKLRKGYGKWEFVKLGGRALTVPKAYAPRLHQAG